MVILRQPQLSTDADNCGNRYPLRTILLTVNNVETRWNITSTGTICHLIATHPNIL